MHSDRQESQAGTEKTDNELSDTQKAIKHIRDETKNNKTPIFIAFLAAFLALVSMADDEVAEAALEAQIEASNQFSYFQAKNIRGTNSEIAATTLEAMGKSELAAKWQKTADRYESEKGDILKAARAEQAKRSIALKQGDNYAVAIALLQIGIVLASISLLTGGGLLLSVSIIFSLLSCLFVVNGYGLFYNIPTDPEMIYKSIKGLVTQP